jgi:phage baseplate assembly protein W
VPLENVSRGFKDISLSFKAHPITYDLLPLNEVSAINRSLRNLVLTLNGERPFNSLLGTNVNRSLFEILDVRVTTDIENEIRNVIKNFEPRVFLRTVNVTPDFEQNGYHVLIDYEVIGNSVPPQQINFILQTVR